MKPGWMGMKEKVVRHKKGPELRPCVVGGSYVLPAVRPEPGTGKTAFS